MKILHIIGIGKLPRDPERIAAGGLTRVALEVAHLQAAAGHHVVVAAVGSSRWRSEWRGVLLESVAFMPRLHLHMGKRKLNLSSLFPLLLLALRYRFDVIHSHELCTLRYLPAGIRITHFHNDPYSDSSGGENDAWETAQCLAAARYSHAHVAVSEFIAERLRIRYGSIVDALPTGFNPSKRIHVVYNGVDLKRFDPERWVDQRRLLRHAWGVSDDEVIFLYSGAVAPDKGVLELARAAIRLSKSTSRVRLVLAGDAALWEDEKSRAGPYDEHDAYQRAVDRELAALIERGWVIRLGLVPPAELPGVYAASDVVVVPSIVQEAFCLAAAEGLAMNKPLIACRVGGLVEFASEVNSVLVPPADEKALYQALRLLAEDDGLKGRLGQHARQSIESYTWSRAARQLDDLYAELLACKNSIVCAKPPAFYRF